MSNPGDMEDTSDGLDEVGRMVDRAAAGERAEELLQGSQARDVIRGIEALRGALDVREGEIDAVLDDETVLPDMSGVPPELPDDFELQGELGRGGMGVVYRARQRSLDRTVAIKVLSPGELLFGHALRRFHREARTLAKLRHPSIVSVHEVGTTAGRLWFSMELIDGESLAQRLKRRPLSPSQSVRLMKQVVSAVAYVHAHGVVHRDLKPANILLNEGGSAFVTDFGLALEVDAEASLTQTGQVLGTPAWMAPEQARGKSEAVGEATDVYGLGALLYACLCGKPPVKGETAAEQVLAVIRGEQVPLRKRGVHVPPELVRIVEKALAQKPEQRYGSARAMLEDLERFEAGKTIRAQPPAPIHRIVRVLVRHRNALFGLGTGMLLGVGLLLALIEQHTRADIDRTLALGQSMLVDEDYRAAERMALDMESRIGDARGSPNAERQLARARLLRSRVLVARGQIEAADRLLESTQRSMDDGTLASWAGAPVILYERAIVARLRGKRAAAKSLAKEAWRSALAPFGSARGQSHRQWSATQTEAQALLTEERPAFLSRPEHPLFALAERWLQTWDWMPGPRNEPLWRYVRANPLAHIGALHATWSARKETGGQHERPVGLVTPGWMRTLDAFPSAVLTRLIEESAWPRVLRGSAALLLAIRFAVPNPFGLLGAGEFRGPKAFDPQQLLDAGNRYRMTTGEERWRLGAADAVAGWKAWRATAADPAEVGRSDSPGRTWAAWVTWYLGDTASPEQAAARLDAIEVGAVAAHLASRLTKVPGAPLGSGDLLDALADAREFATAGAAHNLLALRHPDRSMDIPVGAHALAELVTRWRRAVQPLPTRTRIQLALVQQGPAGWRVVATKAEDIRAGETRELHLERSIPPEWHTRVNVHVPGTPIAREPTSPGVSFTARFSMTHEATGPAVEVRKTDMHMRDGGSTVVDSDMREAVKPLDRVTRLAPYKNGPTGSDMLLLMYATDGESQALPSRIEDWRTLLARDVDRITLGAGTHGHFPSGPGGLQRFGPVELRSEVWEALTLAATLGVSKAGAHLIELESMLGDNPKDARSARLGSLLRLARMAGGDETALPFAQRKPGTPADPSSRKWVERALSVEPSAPLGGYGWWWLARETRSAALRAYALGQLGRIRLTNELAWRVQADHAAGYVDVPSALLREARETTAFYATPLDAAAARPGALAWSIALWALGLLGLALLYLARGAAGTGRGPAHLCLVFAGFGFLAVRVSVGGHDLVPDALGVLFLLLAARSRQRWSRPRVPLAVFVPWTLAIGVLVLSEFGVRPQQLQLLGLAFFALGVPLLGLLVARAAAGEDTQVRRQWRGGFRSGPLGTRTHLFRGLGLLGLAVILMLNVPRAGWLPVAFAAGLLTAFVIWGAWARRRGTPTYMRGAVLLYVVPVAAMQGLMWPVVGTTRFLYWGRGQPDVVEILLPGVCLITLIFLLTQFVRTSFVRPGATSRRAGGPSVGRRKLRPN